MGLSAALHNIEAADLNELIRKLDLKELIAYDDRRNRIRLKPFGRHCYDCGVIPEAVLGFQYCADKYGPAVVRISVSKPNGDVAAGTGFFIADAVNRIVTNRHVVLGNEIQRIEDRNNNVVHEGNLPIVPGPPDLDLALIECPQPEGLQSLRIDWKDSSRPMDEVLVLGYPHVAQHHPALLHAPGRIGMRAKRIGGPVVRESLLLSDVAAPGRSGGPVISAIGMVVGVIEQQSVALAADAPPVAFIGAVPTPYLREVLEGA